MVRRKQREETADIPDWILTYDDSHWASQGGFNVWRQEIRDWCRLHDLPRSDPDTWMTIVANVVRVSHDRSWSESRPGLASAVQTEDDSAV